MLVTGDDGRSRCWWGASTPDYLAYHDEEWGRAITDDGRLFERICLEGFQSGLSWLTILRKRDRFRAAFAAFEFERVASFGDRDVRRLLLDAGIVRHEGKIRSTINNASRAIELAAEAGSLAGYFWSWAVPDAPPPHDLPPFTEASTAISKDLKRRGWSFVGPTTVYAFMQAVGIVNDHLDHCLAREPCALERKRVLANSTRRAGS
jgi:DNA-3-methyladenine glycosylase I